MSTKYIRCLGCGNYFEVTKEDASVYCSPECLKKYVRCIVCGNYFERIHTVSGEEFICSKECAIKYTTKKTNDE